ncbi:MULTISPECIES: GntR family transcriptional regulator [Nocardiopsis]|uniref:GntR family transcriptional regulator n=1 Tax=Nocardiopsis sinuspersici TaxID=501010 RepID=A0A1V3C7W4_9ACTN|nr:MULTISPECIES: GntR family transcriptional regulator [Nocardiopsis]OOC56855.1 GntR family transcriptional regulator [Nocardiopsis sinuspersici]
MSTSRKTVVADHLREALARGEYGPGERLPGEEELAEQLDVSRATARLGMRILQDEGRIAIRAGRGAFVADHRPIVHLATPVTGGGDSERFKAGYQPHLRESGYHQVQEKVKVSLDTMRPKVAKRLRHEVGEAARGDLVVIRSSDRFVEGGLWQSQVTYFPYDIAGNTPLMSPEPLEEGVTAVLRSLGLREEWNWDIVGARMPSQSEADSFGLGPGIPLLVQERVVYEGERPLRFTETVMPANRHQLLYSGGEAPEELLVLASDVNIFER